LYYALKRRRDAITVTSGSGNITDVPRAVLALAVEEKVSVSTMD
jgi:hypothetical protein